MLNFLTASIGLFSHTLDAAFELEFFRFLGGWAMFLACVSLFYIAYRTTRKM